MIAALVLFCLPCPSQAENFQAHANQIAAVRQLYAEKNWDEIVRLMPAASDYPAELDFYRGLALARLQRWAEAKAAFEAGREKEPRDKRFLLELAGIAYQHKDFSEAKAYLKQALRLDPGDAYALNFLATLYFLQGNLEAALQYWNRVGKPRITDFKFDREPRVQPALLDRAFVFSPLSVLHLDDLQSTQARIENLEIFSRYQFELVPDQDESFAVSFHATERSGWGDSKLEGVLSLLRGLPYQTVYPEYYNLRRSALNLVSLLRWDAQKRRIYASLSFPLEQNPKWRLQFYVDGRNENWDLSETFQAPTSPISDLKLKRVEAGLGIRSAGSGRWGWSSGVSFSHRSFRNFGGAAPPANQLLIDGFSLKYHAGLDHRLLRNPEKRVTVDSNASVEFGRLFAGPLGTFSKIGSSLELRWLPRPRGDDYEMNSRFRAGRIIGAVPLDELYALGLERDSDLWLRGHLGTRNGKKGRAPMGRAYVLWNWEMDKIVHQNPFFTAKLGPFLDLGRITDASRALVSEGWLTDPGIQCKVRVLGTFTIVLSYGRDLRLGRNAFYTTVLRGGSEIRSSHD